jgi:hypothetical protein
MKPEDIEVDLIPHTSLQSTRIGVLEVDLGQYRIRANGFCVGYIDKRPGFGAVLSHTSLPVAVQEIIKQKVDVILGRESPPIATASPIILEEEEYED